MEGCAWLDAKWLDTKWTAGTFVFDKIELKSIYCFPIVFIKKKKKNFSLLGSVTRNLESKNLGVKVALL